MPGETQSTGEWSSAQARWQRIVNGAWTDFAAANTIKIERLFRKGDKARSRYLRVWEGGLEHEIDMWHMKIIPGHGKLRRIGPPASVPGRPHLSTVTVPPSYSNQQDLSVDGEGLLGSIGNGKPKRANSAPARKSVPNRKATVPSVGGGKHAGEDGGSTRHNVKSIEDSTKLNVNLELMKLCHPDFQNVQDVKFEFKEISQSWQSRKTELDHDHLMYDIDKLAVEYSRSIKEGEPLVLKSSPHHALAAVSIALHMAGPFKDARAWSTSPPSPAILNSSMSSSSLGSGFQNYPGKAIMDLFSLGRKRPASAPARSRSHPISSPLVDPLEQPTPSMLAGTLQEFPTRLVFRMGRDSQEARQKACKLRNAWREWQAFSSCRQKPYLHPLYPSISPGCKNYDWVTTVSALPRCLDRLQCLLDTVCVACDLKSASDIADEIEILRHSESRPRSALRPGKAALELKRTGISSLSQAVLCSSGGRRAAAVIICSPFDVGGRCFTGRAAFGEEEACLRSTFYLSVREAARQAQQRCSRDACDERPYVPDDGAVLCRKVLVLRDDAKTGYAPFSTPVEVSAVIAVSMPHVTGSKASVEGAMKNKINTILKAANELQVHVLVLTDEGAGSYAAAWASATAACFDLVSKARSPLPEVFLAGSPEYFNTARRMDAIVTDW